MRMRRVFVPSFIALALLAAVIIAYRAIVPGLSSARSEPGEFEVTVATWLLHHSVPQPEAARVNPFGSGPADVTAGGELFKKKCEICHAYDGSGKSEIGAGEYPRPPGVARIQCSYLAGRRDFLSYPQWHS